MPSPCLGIHGTVGGYDADNRGFRIVAEAGLVAALPLSLSARPKRKP